MISLGSCDCSIPFGGNEEAGRGGRTRPGTILRISAPRLTAKMSATLAYGLHVHSRIQNLMT